MEFQREDLNFFDFQFSSRERENDRVSLIIAITVSILINDTKSANLLRSKVKPESSQKVLQEFTDQKTLDESGFRKIDG